jgi:hypothetical protein
LRGVTATFHPLRSISESHGTFSVTWSSSGGALTKFAGALAVEKCLHDDCFGLVISDNYEPPFGAVGAMFDAVLGQRIVHAFSNNQVIPSYKKRTSTLKKSVRERGEVNRGDTTGRGNNKMTIYIDQHCFN